MPFAMNARANYVGKKKACLDSPRTLEEANVGVPNYWAFEKLNNELSMVKS